MKYRGAKEDAGETRSMRPAAVAATPSQKGRKMQTRDSPPGRGGRVYIYMNADGARAGRVRWAPAVYVLSVRVYECGEGGWDLYAAMFLFKF